MDRGLSQSENDLFSTSRKFQKMIKIQNKIYINNKDDDLKFQKFSRKKLNLSAFLVKNKKICTLKI